MRISCRYRTVAGACILLALLLTPSQLFGLSLPLAIGVKLEGKGTVVAVEPGSAAERAGIQVGDRINRINGR